MIDQLLDIEDDPELDEGEIGRKYLFWRPDQPDSAVFSFSSTLSNIGQLDKHDRSLKNKTYVLVLSEPIEATHATRGPILVSKVLSNQIMWVATCTLIPVEG